MNLFRGTGLVGVVSMTLALGGLVGCEALKNKLKGVEDAGVDAETTAEVPDAGASAPTAPTAPTAPAALADNEDDIGRFPDETKLDAAATVLRTFTVRDAPPAGTVVATVSPGQAVKQIASRGKYFVITFDDAKAGKKLMGWVHADAFTAPAATATPLVDPKCTAPEIALVGDNTAFCAKTCEKDADCAGKTPAQTCSGSAAKFDKGKAGAAVKVCSIHKESKDAGAPASTDAGATTPIPTPSPLDAGGGFKLPGLGDGGLKLPGLDGGLKLPIRDGGLVIPIPH